MRPRVGAVMPASSLSNVLLPAPLRPITPTDAPRSTSRFTCCKAQKLVAFRFVLNRYCFHTSSIATSIVVRAHTTSAIVSSTYLK